MKVILIVFIVLLAAWWLLGFVATVGPFRDSWRVWRGRRGQRR